MQRITVSKAAYGLFPYEEALLSREVRALSGVELGLDNGLSVSDPTSLRELAFAHELHTSAGSIPTVQALREAGPSIRPKNSTYGPHGIHRYKGKFYPQLAKSLLNASASGPGVIVDPFGGSGTVATEVALAGLSAVTFDCNPVAVACAQAKISLITRDPQEVRRYLGGLRKLSTGCSADAATLDQFPQELLKELESWFPLPVLRKLNSLLREIRREEDQSLANIGQVLVSDLIREVSQQEPKDLRIRRRREPITDAPVAELFEDRVTKLLERMESLWQCEAPRTEGWDGAIVLGDSSDSSTVQEALAGRRIRAVISSPPYGTALPYIDTDRLSLAAVFSYDVSGRRALEGQMIGSREIRIRELREWNDRVHNSPSDLRLPESVVTFLQAYLECVEGDEAAGFRKRQAPAVLTRYFVAMRQVFESLVPHLSAGADIWMVLGDSQSVVGGRRWTIPTIDSIAAIGKEAGLSLQESIPITVTREDVLHARNTITANQILHFRN